MVQTEGFAVTVLRLGALKGYLGSLHGKKAEILRVEELGRTKKDRPVANLKGFGFGTPYLIEYRAGGKTMSGVFETMRPSRFGHDFPCDRAHSMLLAHCTFNRLPRHVRSLDVGIFTKDGDLKSVGNFKEFFIFLEKVEGVGYHKDLARIRDLGEMTKSDLKRCAALSDYIARLHAIKKSSPGLYVRRIRDLIGHGECIMGLIDSYPKDSQFVDDKELQWIEQKCVEWRWQLKDKFSRLSRVHGDFHPFNIMFRKGTDFTALDRSRGEWGEPADDVAAMSINYILFSLQRHGDLSGPLAHLYDLFMRNYLEATADDQLLEVIQPFYAWRSLVIANPVWYPTLSTDRRRKLFNFIRAVLESERFDVRAVNSYMA